VIALMKLSLGCDIVQVRNQYAHRSFLEIKGVLAFANLEEPAKREETVNDLNDLSSSTVWHVTSTLLTEQERYFVSVIGKSLIPLRPGAQNVVVERLRS
jgi:hypothetical protein